MATQYVRYSDDVEVRRPGEDQIIEDQIIGEIIASFKRQHRKTFDRSATASAAPMPRATAF